MIDANPDAALAPLHDALRDTLLQAQTELGIDTSSILADLQDRGVEDFVAHAVHFPWSPYFAHLLRANRLDLTLESVVCRLAETDQWWEFLLNLSLRWAKSNLELAGRLLAGDPLNTVVGGEYWLVPVQGRTFVVMGLFFNPSSDTLYADCGEAESKEQELAETGTGFYDPDVHNHLLFCADCRSARSLLREVYDFLAEEQFRICRAHLQVLSDQLLDSPPFGRMRAADQYRKARDWRTIILASYLALSGDMAKYCSLEQLALENGVEPNPWKLLRGGIGDPRAAAFVQSLDDRLYQAALLAVEIQRQEPTLWLQVQPDGTLLVPSCGDLPEVPGLIAPVVTWNLSSWKDWIDDETSSRFHKNNGLTSADFLEMAADASTFRGPRLGPSASSQGVDRRAAIRSLVGPDVFDRLCPDAQEKLTNAERAFHDVEGRKDFSSVLNELAGAFEKQIKATIIHPIRAQRTGFAERSTGPGLPPLLREWPFEMDDPNLGTIAWVLKADATPFRSRLEALGFDSGALLSAINEVRNDRNGSAHGESYSLADVRRIRSRWLSVNRPDKKNIFARILPRYERAS
jgi:hypothetical protein